MREWSGAALAAARDSLEPSPRLAELTAQLKAVNEALWDIGTPADAAAGAEVDGRGELALFHQAVDGADGDGQEEGHVADGEHPLRRVSIHADQTSSAWPQRRQVTRAR
jgi:hypothetical protein